MRASGTINRGADEPPLIRALLNPGVFGPGVERVDLIETHVSWVLLTGEHAYKLKKPVDLGFLDFSTLEKRLSACREELRLNRRTAPALYIDVVAVCGSEEHPELVPLDALADGDRVLDYAVMMREFPQAAQLDRRLAAGTLGTAEMDAIALGLAAFHRSIATAGADAPWGEPESVNAFTSENFTHAAPAAVSDDDRRTLETLRRWTAEQYRELAAVMIRRKRDGFVRECHGDLHLTNLAALDDGITAFDCIEFNPALRWIDVISEAAFLMMDLMSRDRDDLAYWFANAYLEVTGDYEALALLRYYLVYRSMVRAKVAAIRLDQGHLDASERAAALAKYRLHLALARRIATPPRPMMVVMVGLSGSGKTWLSQRLLAALSAFRVRSDVERKRLFGLAPWQPSGSGIETDIYTPDATRRTYARLGELARAVASAGFSVIVDGAFLKRSQRRALVAIAKQLGLAAVIVHCWADEAVLLDRIERRSEAGADASEADLAVLRHQQADAEALDADERAAALLVDTGGEVDVAELVAEIERRR